MNEKLAKTSIIIPAYGNLELTKKCVASIISMTSYPDFEIILIDNDSGEEFQDFFKNFDSGKIKFIYLKNNKNLGFSKANNQGVKIASSEILVFLNNDTEVIEQNWLKNLTSPLLKNSEIGLTGAKLLYPDNTIQHAGIYFYAGRPKHLYKNKQNSLIDSNINRYLNAVTAACISIKKELFLSIGGFDENFINGWEDLDLCLRIRKLGKKILYNSNCVLIHHESKTKDRHKFADHNTRLFYINNGIVSDYHIFLKQDNKKIKAFFASLKIFQFLSGLNTYIKKAGLKNLRKAKNKIFHLNNDL